ncbi:cAMP-dependent protein kinase catalytic subunit 3-like [Patiria miniata]|uniref:receptor protein-tyrosine kinase n=1 Tax=Patiria miniata TaxID=46514 RepID=A0A914ADW2_PATMI|nr:cAMP-dependent protein kinase catalytic subunit 3-like [Patiria miniata]
MEGSHLTSVLGTNLTLNCKLRDDINITTGKVNFNWYFVDKLVSLCTEDRQPDGSSCSLVIGPVRASSEGLYKCTMFDGETFFESTTELTVVSPYTTMDLLDLSSGDLVDSNYSLSCVPLDAKRTFECSLRNIKPDRWNLSWLIDDSREVLGQFEVTSAGTGGLMIARSRFTVPDSDHKDLPDNLTCQATGVNGELFTVTVQLQFCSEGPLIKGANGVLIATVALVSVLGTLVVLPIVMFVKFRRNRREHNVQIKRSSVEMDVASDPDALGQPGQSEVGRSPGVDFEDRIAPRGPHKYEDKLATEDPHQYEDNIGHQVGYKYEDSISPQDPHNYEYNISQQVVHKYEDRISVHQVDEQEYDDTTPPQEETPMLPESDDDDNLPPWAEGWEVPRCDLIMDERVLGRGIFGEVRSGAVIKDGELTRAAIKMLKGHASTSEKDDFIDELRTMTSFGHHPNVVSLLGACQHRQVLFVALEYLSRGDLRSYLRTARSQSDSDEDALSSDQLVKFALDVAKGMEHLAKAGVIHRDLAARNILLSEGLTAKVSDFGLSRGEDIYVQTSKRRVPVRWLAIESIRYKRYTTKSDVWSFGILLWEITTIGGTPYPTTRSESLARKLKGGYRMPKPSNCDDKSFALMRKCWEEDPNNRPSFSELVSTLSGTDDSKIEHTYFSFNRVRYENLSVIQPEFDDN